MHSFVLRKYIYKKNNKQKFHKIVNFVDNFTIYVLDLNIDAISFTLHYTNTMLYEK